MSGQGNFVKWLGYSTVALIYEFIGSFGLLMAIVATKGNPVGIGIILFIMLLIGAPISGGHFNPAVTIGVLINMIGSEKGLEMNRVLTGILMVCGQFGGAICGMEFLYMCVNTGEAT
jgi:glycerol uptake facilitator-like aquaporin